MNPKIILALLLSIQVARGNPIDDVIADLTSKISHVKTTIDTILQNGGTLIRNTRKAIGETITEGETEVQGQLDELDNIVRQAEQEAEETKDDISQCVAPVSASLDGINFQKFQVCSRNQDLDLLGQEFGYLRIIKGKLSSSINICLSKNPSDVETLKTCVQKDIDDAARKSDEIADKMLTVCIKATKDAASCSETVVQELDKIISEVAHDFKQCLQQIVN